MARISKSEKTVASILNDIIDSAVAYSHYALNPHRVSSLVSDAGSPQFLSASCTLGSQDTQSQIYAARDCDIEGQEEEFETELIEDALLQPVLLGGGLDGPSVDHTQCSTSASIEAVPEEHAASPDAGDYVSSPGKRQRCQLKVEIDQMSTQPFDIKVSVPQASCTLSMTGSGCFPNFFGKL